MEPLENMLPEQKRAMTNQMREKPGLLESNGDYWSDEDNQKLCDMYDEGYGITDLALMMKRTELAIINRLTLNYKLGRNKQHKERTKIITCKCNSCDLRELCGRYNASTDVPDGVLVCFSRCC